jgi:hypothetical protein
MIREGNIRHSNLNWIDHLDDYIYNRNRSKHGTTKYQPIQVWKNTNEDNDNDIDVNTLKKKVVLNDDEIQAYVGDKLKQKAIRAVEKNKSMALTVGDNVRVLMSSLKSKLRKLIKENKKKLIIVTWSPTIYKVARIIKPNGIKRDFQKERYTLVNQNDEPLLTEYKKNKPNEERKPKYFFSNELQKIEGSENIISQSEANKLNKTDIEESKEEIEPIRKSSRVRRGVNRLDL